jgi:hypothetical protein
MKTKIIKQYQSNFSSSPIEIDQIKIDFIIKNECQCSNCRTSIFEMNDFPNLLIDDDELLCEDCYDDKYREICPICEDYYDIKDYTSDYFVLNEEIAKETGKNPGIYKILKRPFFYGNILTGFDAFFDDSIQLLVSIKINEYKKIECGDGCYEVNTNTICPECVEKFVKKRNYLKTDSIPCILLKKYEKDLFSKYTSEQLRQVRQKLIHQRITCKGIIERANHFADYGKS